MYDSLYIKYLHTFVPLAHNLGTIRLTRQHSTLSHKSLNVFLFTFEYKITEHSVLQPEYNIRHLTDYNGFFYNCLSIELQ